MLTSLYSLGGFDIVCRVVDYGCARADLGTRLIIAVEGIYILYELAVEQVKRNMFGTYARTLAAVRASARNVECSYDMEHTVLKRV